MKLTFDSADELSGALQRAAEAHGRHEQEIGFADPDWPAWYAQFLAEEQTINGAIS